MDEIDIERIEEHERPEIHFCVFTVGEKSFSVPIEKVKEIMDVENVLPLPGSPDYIRGLIQLRGDVLPAVDMAKIFHTEYKSESVKKLILLENDGELLAFISDGMPDLTEEQAGESIDIKKFFEDYRVR